MPGPVVKQGDLVRLTNVYLDFISGKDEGVVTRVRTVLESSPFWAFDTELGWAVKRASWELVPDWAGFVRRFQELDAPKEVTTTRESA